MLFPPAPPNASVLFSAVASNALNSEVHYANEGWLWCVWRVMAKGLYIYGLAIIAPHFVYTSKSLYGYDSLKFTFWFKLLANHRSHNAKSWSLPFSQLDYWQHHWGRVQNLTLHYVNHFSIIIVLFLRFYLSLIILCDPQINEGFTDYFSNGVVYSWGFYEHGIFIFC